MFAQSGIDFRRACHVTLRGVGRRQEEIATSSGYRRNVQNPAWIATIIVVSKVPGVGRGESSLSVFLFAPWRWSGGRKRKSSRFPRVWMLPLSPELSTFGEHGGKHRGPEPSHVTRRFRCLPTEPWDREEPDLYISLPWSAIGSDRAAAILVVRMHLRTHFETDKSKREYRRARMCCTWRRRRKWDIPSSLSFTRLYVLFEMHPAAPQADRRNYLEKKKLRMVCQIGQLDISRAERFSLCAPPLYFHVSSKLSLRSCVFLYGRNTVTSFRSRASDCEDHGDLQHIARAKNTHGL